MTLEEHTKLIQQIQTNASDQAMVTKLLANLSEDYAKQITDLKTATDTADQLKADNENLRSTNLDLFLKVGRTEKREETKDHKQDQEPDNTPEYKDLFDDKGNLI